MRRHLTQLSKLALSGAVIVAIGWATLSVNPSIEQNVLINQAQADIFSFDFAPESKHSRFLKSMGKEGFEQPRSYDWNGNKFFFTLKHDYRKSPVEVSRSLQQSFREQGVNKRAYMLGMQGLHPLRDDMTKLDAVLNAPRAQKEAQLKLHQDDLSMLDDYTQGAIIPFVLNDSYALMSGAVAKKDVTNSLDLAMKTLESGGRIEDQVKRMYTVESFKSGNNRTTTTAVWSDDKLDFNKFKASTPVQNANPDLPSCMGCTLKMRFAGQGAEKPYAINIFQTSPGASGSMAQAFYARALPSRGWKPNEASDMMRRLQRANIMPDFNQAQVTTYARNNQFMTVLTHNNSKGGTTVQVYETP